MGDLADCSGMKKEGKTEGEREGGREGKKEGRKENHRLEQFEQRDKKYRIAIYTQRTKLIFLTL
jgi:hypothetical protein